MKSIELAAQMSHCCLCHHVFLLAVNVQLWVEFVSEMREQNCNMDILAKMQAGMCVSLCVIFAVILIHLLFKAQSKERPDPALG